MWLGFAPSLPCLSTASLSFKLLAQPHTYTEIKFCSMQ